MAKRNREYDDDDGRTIADMSGIERKNLLIPRGIRRTGYDLHSSSFEKELPQQHNEQNSGDGKMYILGALSAALLIVFIFAAVIALVILLFLSAGK